MKEKRIFNRVPVFNDGQIDKQVERQVRFLKAVHPQLEDSHWNEGRIELRPVKRDSNLKDYLRSYGSWHLGEKDVAELKKFLNAINGKGVDLYFSAFAFDYSMDVYKKDGTRYEKGKVNIENALFTSILAADFDGITAEEFQREKQRLLDIGIETIDIFSGHGWQSIILLNHRVSDKEILKKFTTLMLMKGFRVDSAIVDAARVLRMPYSFNTKALDKKTKYYDSINPQIIATTDHCWTERRYHVAEVFERLNGLPDVIKQNKALTDINLKAIYTEPLADTKKRTEKKVKQDIEIVEIKQIDVENLKTVYKMLDFERLPMAIQKILAGTQERLRNKVMFFIIPFLRNKLGLDIKSIIEIMTIWGERCTPILDADEIKKEVNRIYGLGFQGKHGVYTQELFQAYGYLDFDQYKIEDEIKITNSFFDDFADLPDASIRIFLSMKLAAELGEVKEFSKKDIQRFANMSERTVERNIKVLVAKKYVSKRRSNRRNGEAYVYYPTPYFSTGEGFSSFGNALVDKMLKELTDGEMKLYCYLRRKSGNQEESFWASQKHIADQIGKTQQGISLLTDNLDKKGFVKKITEDDGKVKRNRYDLKF
ncbi:helix-turn-helix domain-containing protein [Paenibacillus cellulositrophicus]|uniref:helix-turn-helix domain-containing protein n=1 Tax=Paenibacillus cellulositrophicus TaxID=562959 RepID=UPI00203AB30C|nr:helix-turn-helix domain-containing protein [Paenibacillus cellulositrophicus]MCM3000002.1 helix-turn-helix domain-containing protein [Paenibacillus cellulositrophicus]